MAATIYSTQADLRLQRNLEERAYNFAAVVMGRMLVDLYHEIRRKADVEPNKRQSHPPDAAYKARL